MTVHVSDVLEILKNNDIEFDLRADNDTILDFPIGIHDFSGKGFSFFTGSDDSLIRKWEKTFSGLIICSNKLSSSVDTGPFVFVAKPRQAFVLASYLFVSKPEPFIHPTAIIDPDAKIGKNVSIGAYSVIGSAKIGGNTTIGERVSITENVLIGCNVKICSDSNLGDPCIGSILSNKGKSIHFPHFAKLEIKDNVVIGQGTIIGQGVLTDTVIQEGVQIAGGCFVGHNCQIGKHTYLAPRTTLAGSVTIGERCWLSIGVCIRDGITLADEVTVGMGASVTRSCLKSGTTIMGQPSKEYGNMFSCARTIKNQT